MLVKGQIPSHEPVVSIGLILPEDRVQKLLIMDVENNRSFNINLSKESTYYPTSTYKLSSVRAGRGFHWDKQISITVEGELEIKIVDECLFVINHIPLEKYIISVATSEMSGECPQALLESQTVVLESKTIVLESDTSVLESETATSDSETISFRIPKRSFRTPLSYSFTHKSRTK